MSSTEWLFGYGSLVAEHRPNPDPAPGEACWAWISGYRRAWNIATLNVDPSNDGKFYVDAQTLERATIQVAFVNLTEAATDRCNGVLIPVSVDALRGFDKREVNYGRMEVSKRLSPEPPARAWTYVGLDQARGRYQRGLEAGDVFVASEYLMVVEDGFRVAGSTHHAEYLASTEPVQVPTRDLRLVRRP
jgi:hypothetical protein